MERVCLNLLTTNNPGKLELPAFLKTLCNSLFLKFCYNKPKSQPVPPFLTQKCIKSLVMLFIKFHKSSCCVKFGVGKRRQSCYVVVFEIHKSSNRILKSEDIILIRIRKKQQQQEHNDSTEEEEALCRHKRSSSKWNST